MNLFFLAERRKTRKNGFDTGYISDLGGFDCAYLDVSNVAHDEML